MLVCCCEVLLVFYLLKIQMRIIGIKNVLFLKYDKE